jgi:hypothetical protein
MNRLSLLLLATTLVFGTSTVVLVQELRHVREKNAALQKRLDSGAPPPSHAVEPVTAVAPTMQDADEGHAGVQLAAAPEPSVPSQTEPKEESEDESWRVRWLEQLKNPRFRAVRIASLRLDIERRHPQLARIVGLDPQQAAALLDLLATQQLEQQERNVMLGADDDFRKGETLEERNQRLRSISEKVEAERLALLGADRYQAWKGYLSSAPTWAAVDELRLKLVDIGVPVRVDQVDPLVADLAAERERFMSELDSLRTGRKSNPKPAEELQLRKRYLQLQEDHLDKAHDAASAHLTSNQLDVFDEMLEQQRKQARAEFAQSQAAAKLQGAR